MENYFKNYFKYNIIVIGAVPDPLLILLHLLPMQVASNHLDF